MVTGDIVSRGSGGCASSWCRFSQRVIHGCAPTSRQVKRISHGTTASKTDGSRPSSRKAPSTAPAAQVAITVAATRGYARSSSR